MKEGGALMHLYVWEHLVSLYYRTANWMFTKLGRDEAVKAPHMHCSVSAQGRIQGGTKKGQEEGGSRSSGNFFFRPEGYKDKPNG